MPKPLYSKGQHVEYRYYSGNMKKSWHAAVVINDDGVMVELQLPKCQRIVCQGDVRTALIALDSPLYLKRLAREINLCSPNIYLCGSVAGTDHNPRICGRVSHVRATNQLRVPAGFDDKVYLVDADKVAEGFISNSARGYVCASRS